jgi:hypothetical protein
VDRLCTEVDDTVSSRLRRRDGGDNDDSGGGDDRDDGDDDRDGDDHDDRDGGE